MILFVNIMGQATVIYVCRAVQSGPWMLEEGSELAFDHQQRAIAASEQIVTCAQALTDLHLFKVSSALNVLF